MGRRPNPETNETRLRVVAVWNKGLSQTEIGELMDLTRSVVARLLWEARQRGLWVRSVTKQEGGRRSWITTQRRRAAVVGATDN